MGNLGLNGAYADALKRLGFDLESVASQVSSFSLLSIVDLIYDLLQKFIQVLIVFVNLLLGFIEPLSSLFV